MQGLVARTGFEPVISVLREPQYVLGPCAVQ